MEQKKEIVFISAGDISGDIHAGNLVKSIKKINSENKIFAIGGTQLKRYADYFIDDIVNIDAFGFLPIKQIYFLKKVLKKIEKYLIENKITKVVLVDYYGFNINVAKLAHGLNIPVYYYVCPQVWASRMGRIKKIAKYVKMVFPILPFEKEIYEKENIKVVFEGNPLIDIVPEPIDEKMSGNKIKIGLFAGSRKSVIKRHLPIIIKAVNILKEKIDAEFNIFTLDKLDFEIPDFISVVDGNDFKKRNEMDIVINPSGTVSLENALMGIPMVVMYQMSWLNGIIIRLLIKVKYVTLVNIFADKEIVPEYLQENATPEKIAQGVINQLKSETYAETRQELLKFRRILGVTGVSDRVAQNILGDK
ncbi:lipid-A-disaccharide synthase [Elusimicrobiota bacterium]